MGMYYFLELKVKPNKIEQFETNFIKMMEVHFKHKNGKGKKCQFFKSFVGGGLEVVVLVEIDSFSDMDYFQHTPEMVFEYYGYEKAVEIMNLYADSLCGQKSSIIKPFNVMEEVEVSTASK